jgi:arylsulfatase A-like enzyme
MGDDIGWFNPSCYNRGMMGYRTPNIDRIASEGALFTCWYGQQSCTAGRAAFVTGQSPIRTGLTKVGIPGADVGGPRGVIHSYADGKIEDTGPLTIKRMETVDE